LYLTAAKKIKASSLEVSYLCSKKDSVLTCLVKLNTKLLILSFDNSCAAETTREQCDRLSYIRGGFYSCHVDLSLKLTLIIAAKTVLLKFSGNTNQPILPDKKYCISYGLVLNLDVVGTILNEGW